jgi:superfamily II DNA or RNA helicase
LHSTAAWILFVTQLVVWEITRMELLPGTEVAARGLRWEVVNASNLGTQTLYRLRGLEGALRGEEFDLLHPFEPVEPVIKDLRPERAGPLRNWLVYHQAFLLEQALGSDALLAVQPGRLRIEPYQLVPVLRALRMSRVRLLLADGVGLGKTIQAGLVLTELIARRLAHRILIVSPAGPLLDQWKLEMRERFGLRLDVIDRAKLEEVRRGTELGANPFDHIPLGLASIDFLKQERVLDQLGRSSYDAIVVDEAHHCTDLGSDQDREDSQRRRLAEVLARRCDALLLLTATPHDGNDRSFASLCELLDPSLVDGRGVIRAERYRPYVIRRLKSHVPGFKERQVHPRPVTATDAKHPRFIELQRALLELLAPELRRAFRARRYSDVLAYMALLKRSVSTVEACEATLMAVASRFQQLVTGEAESQESRRQRLRTLREYHRKLERFGSVSAEEEHDQALLEAEELAQQLAALQREIRSGSRALERTTNIVSALDELTTLAGAAVRQDPKLEQLAAEVADIRTHEPRANVLIYTEYVDSQHAAAVALGRAGVGAVLTMSGEDDDATRTAVTNRFRTQDGLILISTDAAAEGLNLHQRCHHLIHLELPFNPNRLEQRNGRIDRYGQQFEPVVRYLYLRGTFEERILMRLIAKVERQRLRLTFVPNTLGVTASSDAGAERLLKAVMNEDQRLFRDETPLFQFGAPEDDGSADEATRELLEEIDRSLKGFEKAARMHSWLADRGLNAEPELFSEADRARVSGGRAGLVDLAAFVGDAVLLDNGNIKGGVSDDIFELVLPPGWISGLDTLPGYDSAVHSMRLTTRIDVMQDDKERPVGFLGRAHPLVRRAVDRVRNLSFGGAGQADQDPRVSVVAAAVPKPTLVFTFLGRVSSRAGRELERVLAVKVMQEGAPEFLENADQWLPLADASRALRTTDVWKRNFASWAVDCPGLARRVARDGFDPVAQSFVESQRRLLDSERSQQAEWLRQRATEITAGLAPQPVQTGLFDPHAEHRPPSGGPNWATTTDPAARLAAFATDRSQPVAKRSEAESVLQIYQQRMAHLEARLALGTTEIVPLGLLMLVPEADRGA